MKLAEALIKRADLQEKVQSLSFRISNNIIIQEGDKPSEEPDKLLKELDRSLKELEDIIILINKTNNNTKFEGNLTLADALVKRDILKKKREVYASIANDSSQKFNRYSNTEIRSISTIDTKEIQNHIDQLSQDWRELDTKIQGINWTVDLK